MTCIVDNYQKPYGIFSYKKPDKLSFKGTTDIFALTDSHQHTDDKCRLLSKVLEKAQLHKNVLVLDNGDLFKGIYPRRLEVKSYLKLKELNPDLEIIINVGNNDPGYNSKQREFFKQAVKNLNDKGIHV